MRFGTALVFQITFGQASVADHDTVRDTDQFHVGELDARAGLLVAVVEQYFKTGSRQVGVEFVRRFTNGVRLVAQRDQRNLERREGVVPDDAVFVAVLFDGSGNHSGNTDAVATHRQIDRLAVFTQHLALHRFAVLGAQLEDVTHFDAALDFQRALAVRAWVARNHVAQVGNGRNRQIALPVDAEIVFVVDVGTDAEVAHQLDRAVDDARQWQVQWAQ